MSDDEKNVSGPDTEGLFTPNGLSIKEMAAKLHEHGYITDEEMAEDGGVAALRRKLQDELSQKRRHFSKFRKP